MKPTFSSIEMQLIRASLETKSDGEIAALLECQIEDVIVIINEITGGKSIERSASIQQLKEKEFQDKNRKTARQQFLREQKERSEKRKIERESRRQQEEILRQKRMSRIQKSVFETRQVDLSKLVSVRIDAKTFVFVKPGSNIEKVKKMYTKKSLIE